MYPGLNVNQTRLDPAFFIYFAYFLTSKKHPTYTNIQYTNYCEVVYYSFFKIIKKIVFRFLAGAADGVAFTVVPMYIGEIADANVRGMLGSSCSVMWIVGFLLINIIGSYLSISSTALLSSLVPVMAFFTFIWMPESPYYLLMNNRMEDAKRSLRIFRRVDNVDEEIERMMGNIQKNTKNTGRLFDLFRTKSNRKAVYIVAGLRGK